MDKYLTTEEAAKILNVGSQAVRDLINRGRLKAEKFGPVWMIHESDLQTVKDRRRGRPRKHK